MKICTIAILLLGLTLPAFSADVAKDPNIYEEGFPRQDQDRVSRAAASLVAIYDGVFTDLTPEYADAMANTGLSPDVYFDPTWDCYSGYPVVLVSTSDNWWGTAAYDDALPFWASYIDDGGKFILVGQDFLWGCEDGPLFAWCYLGMEDLTQDVAGGYEGNLEWSGSTDGPVEGLGGSMSPCFETNGWYTDRIEPHTTGMCMWLIPAGAPYEGGCSTPVSMLSTVEFACGDNLDEVVAAMIDWLDPGFDEITVNADGSGLFPTIQQAIDAVNESGTVLLTDGIFQGPGNYNLDFYGKTLTLQSASGNREAVILDPGVPPSPRSGRSGTGRPTGEFMPGDRGPTGARHFIFVNGEGPNARVESITLRNGFDEGMGGGSVYVLKSSPTFYDCVFKDNYTSRGGVLELIISASVVENCLFIDNQGPGTLGGGMGIYKSSPQILNCLFQGNLANAGGALDIFDCSTPLIEDCVFWGNIGSESGAVALVEDADPTFRNCTMIGNQAPIGSAFWCNCNFTINACIIYDGNSRPFDCAVGPCPTSVSCTDIYSNSEGNWLGDMADLNGTDGNFAEHPEFCNMLYPELEGWHIQDDSPCAPASIYCPGILIGARDVDCGSQATQPVSWSEVKSLY